MSRRWVRPALWALAAGATVADWVAVTTDNRRLEIIAKPTAMGGLTAATIASGVTDRPGGRAAALGMVGGIGGDTALLWGDRPGLFEAGLGSFLLGHLAYLESFRQRGMRRTAWIVPGAAVLAACVVASRDVVPAAHREGGLAASGPVAAYMGVIGGMSLAAWSTGDPVTGIGSSLFVISDTVLALDRFVAPVPHSGPGVMVPYLLGQALLAIGAVRS
ncbi:lysoplasmalogenase [Janibacter sp. GXQ6167]|uniref:lysoplasmalogenase n=1 Tax=Janibacter sp. GXQ6167 TaxID=3240791 RepID=UPI00352426FA